MLLLFPYDLAQRFCGFPVNAFKSSKLFAHVSQHNALDGHSRGGDGVAAEDACEDSEGEAAETT